jgi:hypothetical protein
MRHGTYGPPMLFAYPEIRRMLRLVEAGKDDVFYDLGCGWGQNLIVAATEFGVRKCVGIEMLTNRFRKAKELVSKYSLSKQIKILHGEIEPIMRGPVDPNITIALYSMRTDKQLLNLLRRSLPTGCKLVYYFRNGLFPEIKPDVSDYPFFPVQGSIQEASVGKRLAYISNSILADPVEETAMGRTVSRLECRGLLKTKCRELPETISASYCRTRELKFTKRNLRTEPVDLGSAVSLSLSGKLEKSALDAIPLPPLYIVCTKGWCDFR